MNYSISHSKFSGTDILVAFTKHAKLDDIMRGRELANSLRGRWSIRGCGHLMTPGRVQKWKILFDAGWTAEPTYHYNAKQWSYTLGEHRNVPCHEALNVSRELTQPKPLEV